MRLALIEDVDDVRMPEAGRAACLLLEAAREVLVVGEVGVHDLDRHVSAKPQIVAEIDHCHTAAGNL